MERSASLIEKLNTVSDPRPGEPIYPLVNILFMTICAVIAGADDFVAIAKFANTKKEWFSKFLDMTAGVPSHDRFNAILNAVKPEEFEPMLLEWITQLHKITDGQVIAIDGKTLRRSYDTATGKAAIHMVSAWATANHISLGQTVVDAKSNEITAIPKLLEIIDVSGGLVTIDAMGCQTEIAAKIVDEGADYCLAVKGNQPTLHEGIKAFFLDHLEDDFARIEVFEHHTKETDHGRVDERSYYLCKVPSDLPDASRWKNLSAIGMSINNTERRKGDEIAVRYYILSKTLEGESFACAVRNHWGIENSCHWQLDVTFGEDQCRIRKGHGDENFSTLRRTALSLLKQEKTAKCGVKNRRLTAGWDDDYMEKVVFSR
ncbi:ISAs1 family transposase [Stieleria varia]|uniref:ISAs1 family transposase n=2 Tax=Stieleria varia TaxID=2528005 RepID=UPI00313EB022